MPAKKKFLLRLDPTIYGALEKWAADELRSVNGQIEFLLREALRKGGRPMGVDPAATPEPSPGASPKPDRD